MVAGGERGNPSARSPEGRAIDCAAVLLRERGVTSALLHRGPRSVAAIAHA
jgi:hypothetical protein